MLTGRLPFTGQTPIAVAMKHKTETPPAVRPLRPEVPAWLERVVLRCLEKNPSGRFQSAEELAAELRRPRSGSAQRARRLETGDRVLEDEGETTEWSLVLASPKEKRGWTEGMALRFEGRYYRLRRIDPPTPGSSWTYRFGTWPDEEVFRRLVDYEQDCAEREAAASQTLSAKLTKWIGSRKA
jgi:serine/threonine protein kinase